MVGGKDNIATGPGLVTVRPRKETKQSYFMLLLYAVNTYERGYRTVWARDGMSRWRELLPYALLVLYWQCLEFVRDPREYGTRRSLGDKSTRYTPYTWV